MVLRDGRNAGELAKSEITHDNMVRLMVGRDMKQFYPKVHRTGTGGKPVLALDCPPLSRWSGHSRQPSRCGLARSSAWPDWSERVAPNSRKPSSESDESSAGEVRLDGESLRVRAPADAIAAGVLLVPEDRRLHGLVLPAGVGFNLSLPNLDRLGSLLGVRPAAEAELHRTWIERLRIKTPSAVQPVGLLSGGNQQKVVYGKWLAREPSVLILDEPTRGVDVGAKAEIYALIDELAGRGVAVWMITSDMEELLGMADRVVVMHEGRVAGELAGDARTEETVMRLATGGAAT